MLTERIGHRAEKIGSATPLGSGSRDAQTEGVTCGVEEHSERRAGLMLGASRAQLEYRPLPSVEIINHDVDVHLLRNGLPLAIPVGGTARRAGSRCTGRRRRCAPRPIRRQSLVASRAGRHRTLPGGLGCRSRARGRGNERSASSQRRPVCGQIRSGKHGRQHAGRYGRSLEAAAQPAVGDRPSCRPVRGEWRRRATSRARPCPVFSGVQLFV